MNISARCFLALTDEDAEVRRIVVEILANCRDEDALDGLQLALQDEDIWVRSSAVRGLGRVGGAHSRALVEKALADPVGLVSIAALETLAEPGRCSRRAADDRSPRP